MVKFFKWKRILVVLGMVAGVVIISSLTIRWPINTFPAIEGKILDATTGEPIENVVVSVDWIRSSPGPAGEITRTIRKDIAITDKEGKYRIPRLWSLHLFSVFSRGYIGFYHPLYGSKQAVAARERRKIIIGSPALKAYPEEFQSKDGVIHYDIELLSLQEKYNKPEDNYELSTEFEVYGRSEYFLMLKKRKIYFDLDKIFDRWEKLANRFPDEEHFPTLQRRLKKAKENVGELIGKI